MKLRKTFILLALMTAILPLAAQEKTDYEKYAEAAGKSLPLFRGRQALIYRIAYNGTYWWDLEGFLPGRVTYEGKLYDDVSLNIDANLQQLLLQWPKTAINIELDREGVEWFTRGEEKYLNLNAMGHPEAPAGYFLVLHEGKDSFLLRVDRHLEHGVNGRMNIGYDSSNYNDDIMDFFAYLRSWYILKENGELVKVRNRRAFLKQYPQYKKDIRRNIKDSGTTRMDFSNWGTLAMELIESRQP